MNSQLPKAPRGLKSRGKAFWTATVDGYELTDSELAILTEACRTLDNLDALNAAIAETGPTVEGSRGQVVVNPALTEVRGQRLTLHRLLSSLRLPDEDGQTIATASQLGAQAGARARWNGTLREVK